jgi:hypothetical protein
MTNGTPRAPCLQFFISGGAGKALHWPAVWTDHCGYSRTWSGARSACCGRLLQPPGLVAF